MKKVIFCLLLSFKMVLAIAQEYTPFPTTEAIWSGIFSFRNLDIPTTSCWEINLLNIDTVINGKTYKKITERGFSENIEALREQDKKVYIRVNNKDSLLYNFNLKIGDTLNNNVYGLNTTMSIVVITKIDSILIDGKYRKRFFGNSGVNFIEGIGSPWGFLPLIFIILDGSRSLKYHSVANKILYGNINGKCDFTKSDEISNKNQLEISITPNPITEISYLKIPSDVSYSNVIVYDVLGKIIRSYAATENEPTILKKDYTSGIYFAHVYAQKKLIARVKFVVQ
jgi:Secretion system C-terminal sorting domain